MIVCDRCGKPVCTKNSLITKVKTFIKMEPGKMYPASFDPVVESEKYYDLCQECLGDVLKNLREFVNQGKFNGELK